MRSNYRRPAGRFGEDNGDDDFERPAIRPAISFPSSPKPMRSGKGNIAVDHAYTNNNPILSDGYHPSLVQADDLSSLGNDHTVAGDILYDPLAGVVDFEYVGARTPVELYPAAALPEQAPPRWSTPVGAVAAVPVQANPDEFTIPSNGIKYPTPTRQIKDSDLTAPQQSANSVTPLATEEHETVSKKKPPILDTEKTEPWDNSSKRKKKKKQVANSNTPAGKVSNGENKEAKKKEKKKTKRKSKGPAPPRAQERLSSSNGNTKRHNFSEVLPTEREIVLKPLYEHRSSKASPSELPEFTLLENPLEAGKKLIDSKSENESMTRIPSITDESSIYQNSVLFDDFSVQPFDDDELKRRYSNRHVTPAPPRAQRKLAPFQYPKQGVEILQVLEVTDEKAEDDKRVEHRRSDLGRSLENAIYSTPKIRPPPKKKLFALPKTWGGRRNRRGGPVEI